MLLRGLRGTIRTSALAKVDKTCGSAPTAEHWIIHWEMVNVMHHKPGSQSVAGGRSKVNAVRLSRSPKAKTLRPWSMKRWAVGGVWTVDRVSNPKRGNKADEGEGGERATGFIRRFASKSADHAYK